MPVAAKIWVQGYNTGLSGSPHMAANLHPNASKN